MSTGRKVLAKPMYPVIDLGDRPAELPEQLGNKEKYWFRVDNRRYLLKIGRPGTGENWAEKIAAELADLLGVPHADYDFALWRGHKGVWTPSIEPADARLILGNELLAAIHAGYPRHEVRRVREHTLGVSMPCSPDPKLRLPPGGRRRERVSRTPSMSSSATCYSMPGSQIRTGTTKIGG